MEIDLTTHLPFRVAVLSNYIKQGSSDRFVAKTQLSSRDWRVISVLAIQGAMTPAQIADLTGLDRPTISRSLKVLLTQNYLQKQPNNLDGRSYVVSLTKQGQLHAQELLPLMQQSDAYFKNLLSMGEQTLLFELLEKLEKAARQLAVSNTLNESN
ncbi:MAG: MarR family transcriptional regulator [Gammaproteobacteria bacterium]|nr:MarR family transcriptional regulator [Gammaproteobacteria bacterium]